MPTRSKSIVVRAENLETKGLIYSISIIHVCDGIIFGLHIMGHVHLSPKAWDDVLGVSQRSCVTTNDTSVCVSNMRGSLLSRRDCPCVQYVKENI